MRSNRTLLAVGAISALLALAGCGEDDERPGEVTVQDGRTGTAGTETTKPTTAPSGKAVATVRVTETEFELDPANPRVRKTGIVEFRVRNAGQVAHALEVEGPKGEVETSEIPPGESATLKADLSEPGSYTWYCPVGDHEQRGMKGKIRVARGGSVSGTSTTDESGRSSGSGAGEDTGAGY
jgi:uncharacterized cupredoxin-like copper-binding protein